MSAWQRALAAWAVRRGLNLNYLFAARTAWRRGEALRINRR